MRFRFANELDDVQKYDLVILIDGTGKIDFTAVEDLLNMFEADTHKEVGFVFGRRKPDHLTWGMTPERKELERFENHLIKHALQVKGLFPPRQKIEPLLSRGEFKDLQCGCWGFRGEHFGDVVRNLTASHYDLEIDVFVSAFRIWQLPRNRQRNRFVRYADVTLAGREEDVTRRTCIKELEDLTAALEKKPFGVTDADVGRAVESASLLLRQRQSNFKPKDNIFKLAAIAVSLGVGPQEYQSSRQKWARRRLNADVMSAMRKYWELASQLFQTSQDNASSRD